MGTQLAALTSDVAHLFDGAAARAGLELVIDCPPLPAPVNVDRGMWENIVSNLLANAIKFTPRGTIRVRQVDAGERVRLTVTDSGVGIAGEDVPHVFERFYRAGGAAAAHHEGVGIGLALVAELVRLHGGTVSVDSVAERGSTFIVQLPYGAAHATAESPLAPTGRAASATKPAATVAQTPSGRPGAPRLFVVEDDEELQTYLARLLGADYALRQFRDGQAALAAALADPPDLILSDLLMPRLDGLGLLRALRAESATRDIPFVLLSARADEDPMVEGLESGADDYLAKPFSARELLVRVATHLELARMGRQIEERRFKDEFLTVVGHELNTPLTALQLGVQRAQAELAASGAAAATGLTRLDSALRRIQELVDGLLQVAMLDARTLTVARGRHDLAALCRAVASEVGPDQRRPIALRLPDGAVDALIEPEAMRYVVKALLGNAIKFSPPGLELPRPGGHLRSVN